MRFLLVCLLFAFATSCKQPNFDDIKDNALNQDDLAKLTSEELLALAQDRLAKAETTTTEIIKAGNTPNAPISVVEPFKQVIKEQLNDIDRLSDELNKHTDEVSTQAKFVIDNADKIGALNQVLTAQTPGEIAPSSPKHQEDFLEILKEAKNLAKSIEEPKTGVCLINETEEDIKKREALAKLLVGNVVVEGNIVQEKLGEAVESPGYIASFINWGLSKIGCPSVKHDAEALKDGIAKLAIRTPDGWWEFVKIEINHATNDLDEQDVITQYWIEENLVKNEAQAKIIYEIGAAFVNDNKGEYEKSLLELLATDSAPTKDNVILMIAIEADFHSDEELAAALNGGIGAPIHDALKAAINQVYVK